MLEVIAPERVGLSQQRLLRIGGWMQQHVDQEHLGGISVLVQRRGEVAYFDAAGQASGAGGAPIGPETIFRIYSMSKPITSVAAMMLFEEGRFHLDDPVAKFLPEFTQMQVLVGGDAHNPQLIPARSLITLEQLLTHTAGFSYDSPVRSPVEALYQRQQIGFSGPGGSLAERVRQLAALPLLFQPGTRWNYSVATDVLGRVIEVIAGQPLDRFLEERIFKPLGMGDTGFWVRADKLDRFTDLHAAADGLPPRIGTEPVRVPGEPARGLRLLDAAADSEFARPPAVLSGGGGLVSSASDYLRFCRMLLNKGELGGQRLLGRKTVEAMTANHLPGTMAEMGEPRFNNGHLGAGLGFGLGFAVVLDPIKTKTPGSVGEYFWSGVASTQFWVDPREELIVIQMAQLLPTTLLPLHRELRTLVYQALVD